MQCHMSLWQFWWWFNPCGSIHLTSHMGETAFKTAPRCDLDSIGYFKGQTPSFRVKHINLDTRGCQVDLFFEITADKYGCSPAPQ
uniref:Uncharacterized protein n=1 Tax=Arundo donax TaxID=35708 RepID=A0A0A9FIP4_ARUDO